jgi:hypothetical protein
MRDDLPGLNLGKAPVNLGQEDQSFDRVFERCLEEELVRELVHLVPGGGCQIILLDV